MGDSHSHSVFDDNPAIGRSMGTGPMGKRLDSIQGFGTVILLVAAQSLAAPSTPAGLFHLVKVGQWVELEGMPQKDQTVLCSEVKILTGDFLEDDWNATG